MCGGLSVCVSVHKISQKIEPIYFFLCVILPCDPGRKPFDFGKQKHPGVRVCVCVCGGGGSKFGPNHKR